MVNRLGHTSLAPEGLRAGYAIDKEVKSKDFQYGGTYGPAYKLIPLALSACGDYTSSARDVVQALGTEDRNTGRLFSGDRTRKTRHSSKGD